MMSFNDFLHKHNFKNKATSNIKIYEVLKKIGLDSKVGICLRDGDFLTSYGIVNLHPSRGTHWMMYNKDCYFDSYGLSPPKKLHKNFKNKYRNVFILKIRFKKNDIFFASYCLYLLYLNKVLAIDFKSAVLNLYYQRFF